MGMKCKLKLAAKYLSKNNLHIFPIPKLSVGHINNKYVGLSWKRDEYK